MTEDEAKTKWCPFARVIMSSRDGNSFEPSFNRMVDDDSPRTPRTGGAMNCIGSACMAWMPKSVFIPDSEAAAKGDTLIGDTVLGGDCGLKSGVTQ